MLLGLAGSLLKTLGKKKSKKNGKQVADSITNQSKNEVDKTQNPTTVFHESGVDLKPLEDVRDDIQASSKKKKDPLNLALDGIDNALFGIIDTLTETNILRKKIKSDAAKAQLDKKKSLRERVLEGGKKFVKGAVGSAKKSVGNTWDKIMQFLTWIILGAVVNWIMKNWKSVREQIEKVMSQLKEVFERLKPILVVIKDIVMWFGTTGWDWIVKLNKVLTTNDSEKIEQIKKLVNDQEALEKSWKGNSKQLEQFMKEIKAAKNEQEEVIVMKKYKHLFDNPSEMVHKALITDVQIVEGEYNITTEELKRRIEISEQNLVQKKESIDKELGLKDTFNLRKKNRLRREWVEMKKIDKTLKTILKEREQNNTSSVINQSNTTLLNKDISSYSLGIEEYSDLSEVFGTTNIFLLDDSNSSSNNASSSGSSLYYSETFGIDIKDMQLLNIDSK